MSAPKSVEQRLRDDAAQQRREHNPGDLFWAHFPGTVWRAYQDSATRRVERNSWLRRLIIGLTAMSAVSAALLLIAVRHPSVRPPQGGAVQTAASESQSGSTAMLSEPGDAEEELDLLDEAAMKRLVNHLQAVPIDAVAEDSLADDAPLDVLIDRMSERELIALAARLGKS